MFAGRRGCVFENTYGRHPLPVTPPLEAPERGLENQLGGWWMRGAALTARWRYGMQLEASVGGTPMVMAPSPSRSGRRAWTRRCARASRSCSNDRSPRRAGRPVCQRRRRSRRRRSAGEQGDSRRQRDRHRGSLLPRPNHNAQPLCVLCVSCEGDTVTVTDRGARTNSIMSRNTVCLQYDYALRSTHYSSPTMLKVGGGVMNGRVRQV